MRLTRKSLVVAGTAAALTLAVLPGVGHAAPTAATSITQVGDYFPVTPSRILDTREGNGAPKHTVGAGQSITLQVAGRGGIPSTGVSAIVLNVTVTNASTSSYVTVYPTGITRPTASNLNIVKSWTGANSVTVKLGAGGAVDLFNAGGTLDLIADVNGYYASVDGAGAAGSGGETHRFIPFRELDTRDPDCQCPLSNDVGNDVATLPIGTDQPAVNSHIRAVAVNVTAVGANAPGYFTAWSGAGAAPTASLLNFTPGAIVPNFAIIPTMPCPYPADVCPPADNLQAYSIKYTGGGQVDLIVDVLGFIDDNTVGNGLHFTPSNPVRIVDTRSGLGIPAALGPAATANMVVPAANRDDNTFALSANVTGVLPTTATFVQLWPTSQARPVGSTLNLVPGDVKPNAAFVSIDNNASFSVYNGGGTTNVVIDVNGIFDVLPPAASAASSARPSSVGGQTFHGVTGKRIIVHS